MAELTIRGMEAEDVAALEERAGRHGRTLEEEARHLLREAAAEQRLIADLERVTAAARGLEPAGATARAPSVPPSRRRRRSFEPTPGRR